MTFRDFVMKTIRNNLSKYGMFMGSITIAIAVFFMFSTVWLNDDFKNVKAGQLNILFTVAGIVVIVFSVCLIQYTHSLFLKSRGREFGILLSYGLSYRDLLKMIWVEGLMIYGSCILLAYVFGSVLSRLFFMISTTLLDVKDIEFVLTYKSFTITFAVFAPICLLTLLLSSVRLSRMKIIMMNQLEDESEFNNKGRFSFFLIGCLLTVASIFLANMYTRRILSENIINWKLISLMFMGLVGVYFLIYHFSSYAVKNWKKETNPNYYHFAENASFVADYSKNRKLMLMMTILSFGVVLFVSVTFTLMHSSFDLAENESVFEIEYQELPEIQFGNTLNTLGLVDMLQLKDQVQEKTLDFIYGYSSNLIISTWRTDQYISMISVNQFNQVFNTSYQVDVQKCILIETESVISEEVQYFDETVNIEQNKVQTSLSIAEKHREKIFSRYLFPQPAFILINEKDYQKMMDQSALDERGTLHLIQVENWVSQKKFSENFREMYRENVWDLWNEGSEPEDSLIEKYGYSVCNYRDKYQSYNHSKELGAFSLYIMSFISILFVFAITVAFYFNVYSNQFKDQVLFSKLKGIGLSELEGKRILSRKIKRTIFMPVLLGSLVGMLWCYALNFNRLLEMEVKSATFFLSAMMVSVIYCGYILLVFNILKSRYYRLVKVF